MNPSKRMMGLILALLTGMLVTVAVTSAEALTCNVTDVRVTTRTLNSNDIHPDPLVVDGAEVAEGNIMFYFGTATTWTYGFTLNNSGVEDFRQGAIDEFTQHYSSSLPVFPTHFQRLKIGSLSTTELWGMAGFRVEIKCSGQSAWWGIYTNRGLNKLLGGLPNFGSVYSTSVGVAGTDSYNGDHEVFWLMNIGDHDADGIPDDLANCNSGGDVKCRVQAILSDANRNDIANAIWPLTESWWDMGNSTFVNPLQAQQPGEYHEEPDPLNPANTIDVYTTDNIWRWFYTSNGQDPVLHSAVASARLKLDQCTMTTTDCTMQTNYLHATALQAWGKQSYTPYPYFRSHIYEGDFNTTDAGGWLTVTGIADTDFVATYNKRYYGFSGTHWHVENTQDSEHMTQQFKISCGYKSTDMILSTRGFPYENIATDPQFDDPAFAGAETWEEAIAVAHLVWGYKTMCCGSWDCCDDASDCTSSLSGNPKCTAANIADWWTKPRCLHDGVDKWCFDEIGDYDDDGNDRWDNPIVWPGPGPLSEHSNAEGKQRYFWRDTLNAFPPHQFEGDGVIYDSERFTHLIDGNGEIHWECRTADPPGSWPVALFPTDDDDDDTLVDGADWPEEFWTTNSAITNDEDAVCIRGANSDVLRKFLEDQVSGSIAEGYSTGHSGDPSCQFNPSIDHWFGYTKSVVDSLSVGYGVIFTWNHHINDGCGASHYSVVDGFESIYHPSTATYDYLFFISDPNLPWTGAGSDMGYEGMDNVGFSGDDFYNTVNSVTIWNYDFYL